MIPFVSQSMLNQFFRCQEQWRRRWIENEIIPPGIPARRGTATHKAISVNHIQKITTKTDLPLGDLQDAARDEYVRVVKEEGVFIPKEQVSSSDRLLGEGLDSAVSLTALYHQELAPLIQPIMAEERQKVDIGLSAELQGTIDVVGEGGWLIDAKTSDKSKPESFASKSVQLSFYAGLYYSKFGEWPQKISMEILINSKIPKLQSIEATRGPREWQMVISRIQMMLAQIQTGLFQPCSPDSWICTKEYCGYWSSCKWGKGR